MERYEQLVIVGEGSYGEVIKCRHKETDQVVAIKKFLETEEDASARRMALREIRMLKKLKHENLVAMIEVFRHRKRFYLVFEFLEGTLLDELEKIPGGLGEEKSRDRIFQVVRAIGYCHSNNIIHRDVKPENVLVSTLGVVKLCDFGFARLVSNPGEPCTDYVATRWYRAPELLVGDYQYGPPVDVWAIGCLFAEIMSGEPLFPGESDIDQLYLIVKTIGKPCSRHQQLMSKNSQLRGMTRTSVSEFSGLYKNFPHWSLLALEFLINCVKMDPLTRSNADELLKHNYFTHDKFCQKFLPTLREKVNMEFNSNPLLRKYKAEILMSTDKRDEIKARRVNHLDQPRWRLSLAEGSVKRKFNCDLPEAATARTIPKTYAQKTGMTFLKSKDKIRNTDVNEEVENELLKSLERLSQRPSSATNDLSDHSPHQYQSLQMFETKTTPTILHPYINNITFNKEPQKKSPNIIQSIHNTSIKGTFNQVPLLGVPRGVRKIDKQQLDNIFVNIEPLKLCPTPPAWSSNNNINYKKKEVKARDEFTLPNLPGATVSPAKNKGKPNLSPELLANMVTPRILSASSQKMGSSKNSNNIFPNM